MVHLDDPVAPLRTRPDWGVGIEQFHHPRPVCFGYRSKRRPTPQRRELLEGLEGRVVELGAGDGLKLTCYPRGVKEILLVEADPFLRAAAKSVTKRLTTSVRILDGDLMRLPVPDASCDAVVCALVLCCSPRLNETFREIRRILRPGGELRFYEHQKSGRNLIALTESLVAPVWSRVSGGCHPAHDPLADLAGAGFVIKSVDRFVFRHFNHVLGVAHPG